MSIGPTQSIIQIERPALHRAQRAIVQAARRYTVLACGRRWGKSTLAVALLIDTAVMHRQPAAYFAPTYKLMLDVWRELTRRLRPVATRVNAAERRIELLTGGVIECWSLR